MNECINRNSIYNKLQALFNYWLNSIESQTISISYAKQKILPMIMEELPASDVAPVVHGRWEWFDEDTGTPFTGYEREWGWRCSHCGHILPDDFDDPDRIPTYRYCMNCGAQMFSEV